MQKRLDYQSVMYSPHARHVGSQVNQRGLLLLVKTTTTTNNNCWCDTISPAVYNIPPFFNNNKVMKILKDNKAYCS